MKNVWPRVLAWIGLLAALLLIQPALGAARPARSAPTSPVPSLAGAPLAPAQADKPGGRLDSALAELSVAAKTSGQAARATAQSAGLRVLAERVQAEVRFDPARREGVLAAIEQAGGTTTQVSDDRARLQAWLPIGALDTLATDAAIVRITRPNLGYHTGAQPQAGQATTEGLAIMNAPAWHAAGYTGAGVKIAVIDLGFAGYGGLLGSELPASLSVKNFVDGENDSQVGSGADSHGAGCAEIIYDVAPGAKLYLVKIATELDLEQAVGWLVSQHVQVISTSLAWYATTPGDGTGFFADLVQYARDNGITWVISAGNERQSHWEGQFDDDDADGFHNFFGAEAVDYIVDRDGAPLLLEAGQHLRAFLSWDDWHLANQDYDLYAVRWDGQTWQVIGQSLARQSGAAGQTPTEAVFVTTSGAATYYGYAIYRYSSNRLVNLKLVMPSFDNLYYHLNRFVAARSIANLADAPAGITVAAANSAAPFTQAAYSSEGPADGPGGTLQAGLFKPDMAAYTFVSTSTFGTGSSRFIGTSAASPHVAGAAALILSWQPQSSPADVQRVLQQRAIDLGSAGADTQFGYGRLFLGAPQAGELFLPLLRR